MKRIHIIGRKNSGKTTLVVDLVRHFTDQGVRVGTVKHTHHRHELDTPGKDSFRHGQAGAAAVGILSPSMNAVFWPGGLQRDDIVERYDHFESLMGCCDLVLVEGDSQTTAHKVEVWREANGVPPLAETDPSILALVTDDSHDGVTCPLWSRNDVPALAARLLELTA